MGGKRTSNARSHSGGQMQPRISSADSTKSSIIEPISIEPSSNKKQLDPKMNNEEDAMEYSSTSRKSSFDIISLLEGHGEDVPEAKLLNGDDNRFFSQLETRDGSDVPSFWRFVQPETANHEIFHHHPTFRQPNKMKEKNRISNTKGAPEALLQVNESLGGNHNKRTVRRRKVKKAQSAKVASFKVLGRSPDRLQRDGVEWLRVLTPPRTDISSSYDADPGEDEIDGDEDDEEDDELIKRYFSALSSAGSSISWAEDAMESEFTKQLMKLWEDIEVVCGGGSRPEKMSDAVYDECLQWKKAFPNPDLHRFSSSQNDAEISSVESPTIEESVGDDDAPFSSLVNSPRVLLNNGSSGKDNKSASDQCIKTLQTNFRALNCATPRPNIEKSTEYVNAWLSECQNSYIVPAKTDPELSDYFESASRPGTPSVSYSGQLSSSPPMVSKSPAVNDEIRDKSSKSRLLSEVARAPYMQYSRSRGKYMSDHNSEQFLNSMSNSNDENLASNVLNFKSHSNFDYGSANASRGGERIYPSGIAKFSSDQHGDDDRDSPTLADNITEIVSRRRNVRVQRPISSRIRDHTIVPIATGSPFNTSSSYFGNRLHYSSSILNKHAPENRIGDCDSRTSNQFPQIMSEDYQTNSRGAMASIPECQMNSASPSSSRTGVLDRIRSGNSNKEYSSSLTHSFRYGKSHQSQQQAPWSRHAGEENDTESNYTPFIFENFSNGTGFGGNTFGNDVNSRTTFPLPSISGEVEFRSPTGSTKNESIDFSTSSVYDRPTVNPKSENLFNNEPIESWFMNRRISPN